MAAFMRRFAKYLGAEDGTPAQAHNADLLDGVDGSDFLRAGEAPSIETVAAVGTVRTAGDRADQPTSCRPCDR